MMIYRAGLLAGIKIPEETVVVLLLVNSIWLVAVEPKHFPNKTSCNFSMRRNKTSNSGHRGQILTQDSWFSHVKALIPFWRRGPGYLTLAHCGAQVLLWTIYIQWSSSQKHKEPNLGASALNVAPGLCPHSHLEQINCLCLKFTFLKQERLPVFNYLSIWTWFRSRTSCLKETAHHQSPVSCRSRSCFFCTSFCIQEHFFKIIFTPLIQGFISFMYSSQIIFQLWFRLWWEQEMETRQICTV